MLALFIIGGVGGLAATTAIQPNAILLGAQGGGAGAGLRLGDAGSADAALRR